MAGIGSAAIGAGTGIFFPLSRWVWRARGIFDKTAVCAAVHDKSVAIQVATEPES